MTHPEIEAFLAVVRYGSIKQAAERLILTPSTISQRLHSLETELDRVLIERSRGKSHNVPTEYGYSFIPLARRWLKLWEDSQNLFTQADSRHVTVASSKSIYKYIMSDIYRHFYMQNLPVEWSFTTPTFHDAYRTLKSGETNFALFSNIESLPHMTILPVFNERMVFVCTNGSSYPDEVHPASLKADREIYLGQNSRISWGDAFVSWHNYWFPHELSPYLIADNTEYIEYFFSKSIPDLWCIVPSSIAETLFLGRKAEPRKLLCAPFDRTTYLLTMHDNLQNHYCTLLLDGLRACLTGREGYTLLV